MIFDSKQEVNHVTTRDQTIPAKRGRCGLFAWVLPRTWHQKINVAPKETSLITALSPGFQSIYKAQTSKSKSTAHTKNIHTVDI
jgi:hypothetical protein